MENVITFGKLIGLLFLFCPPLYFVFENSKNTRNELACPVMGTIFLVIGRAKRAPHWGVQSKFRVIYMWSVGWSVCLSCTKMRRQNYVRACSKSFFGGKN